MHILNVSLRHIIGGTPQVCLDYTTALVAQGARVTTLIRKDDRLADSHQKAGGEVIYTRLAGVCGSYCPFSSLYFMWLMWKLKPDVVIVHDGRSLNLCRAAGFGRVPVIDVNHGRGVKQSCKTSGTILINPQQLIRARQELPDKKYIECISNMVDVRIDSNVAVLPNKGVVAFTNKWRNPPIIGALGRLVDEKAFDILIDALAILKTQNIPFYAIIGGDGALRGELEKQVKSNNLSGDLKLYGWVDNPDEFYKKMDIFCLSSRSEACPKVLLEAMKYGLPVVVTDAEGPCDIIRDGYDGIMVEKNNPQALASGLRKMLENKNLAEQLAQNAQKTIIENYSVEVVGKKLIKMCERVVENQ